MKVETRRQFHVGADGLAHASKNDRLGCLAKALNLHRTVEREVDAVEVARVAQALKEALKEPIEAGARDGPTRHRHRRRKRHGLHVAREARSLDKPSQFRVREEALQLGAAETRSLGQRGALEVMQAVKVRFGREHRRR